MTSQDRRRATGGRIDRGRPLRFRFDGREYIGFAGDTLASALIASGVHLVARSFRYHRPRGIFSAGPEENHALVCVGEGTRREPNVRATTQPVYEGLVAASQRGWPSVNRDLGALLGSASAFLPTGFYYKTFMWPRWKYYEGLVRHSAGIAPAPHGVDPDRYDRQNAHCDVMVIGAGPAGLAAALVAGRAGLRVMLADSQAQPGGSLWWNEETIDGQSGVDWAAAVARELQAMPNVELLTHTAVVSIWDHGYITAVQQLRWSGTGRIAQRYWKIRAREVILATGAIERPLVFPDNDRPGIMLADSARQFANRYAALPGTRAVVYTNNDSAYRGAVELQAAGVEVAAIVDVRLQPDEAALRLVGQAGIRIHTGHQVIGTRGRRHLRQAMIRRNGAPTNRGSIRRMDCDLLCLSGGWEPALDLYSQAGGRLRYEDALACLVADDDSSTTIPLGVVGAASGHFELQHCLDDGHRTGEAAAARLGMPRIGSAVPVASSRPWPFGIQPHWQATDPPAGKQFVDHLHDVTVDSIATAAREGYTSVEHLKRYTTTGMSMDQGKTGNLTASAILGELTGRQPAAVGTTTFRPPVHPVSLGALAGREVERRSWPVRRLPLHDWHVAAGGIMEDHGGWHRPAFYPRRRETEPSATNREALTARRSVVLFDSSSLGKIEVCGPDAARFLNRIYINNVEALTPGRVRYGMMLDENGVIRDDGVFARISQDSFLLSTSSAGRTDVLLSLEEWLQTEWPELDVLVHDGTTQWATLAIIGPRSRELVSTVLQDASVDSAGMPHMSFMEGHWRGIPFRLMRVSFTGEMSFELSVPAGCALAAWEELMEAGKAYDIVPLGMEALDLLRVEKGYLEVGVDTDVTTSPLDVGWAAAIARKEADFIGRRSLSRPDNRRPDRLQLVGLEPRSRDRLIPVGTHAVDRSGRTEGHVTSSCISPALGHSIAMAMLKSGFSRLGEEVLLDLEGERIPARVVPLSFYDPDGSRLRS